MVAGCRLPNSTAHCSSVSQHQPGTSAARGVARRCWEAAQRLEWVLLLIQCCNFSVHVASTCTPPRGSTDSATVDCTNGRSSFFCFLLSA
mmetsp:Transcript_35631/g.100883  ORF Transcript_35631/g.100883 Transcript_35631/m.100883 type:complete len:90 (-) Transcript_35631:266-535(-)